MYCRDRPVVPEFEQDELLFRRCRADQVDVESERALAPAFQFPGNVRLSVNRGRFSEPGDCRYPDRHHDYVVKVTVRDIPPILKADNDGNTCHFRPVHDPIRQDDQLAFEFENYGHSEIRAYRDAACAEASRVKKNEKLPGTVKLAFRQKLADQSRIALTPSPELNPPTLPTPAL
jgi:hypothetical protein